ncbi:hypothetical protein UPYG_G00214090 [Umbra pygmaea]|uniref:Uncharacterized protein n=1 Tax=Umbra pygmaea TaxID=75934 RepID=A0ABD0WQ79_UMBPY
MDSHNFFCYLALSLFLGSGRAVTIHGYVGNFITLTCKYNAGYYGALSVCWGRGHLPNSGCNNEILKTEGLKVTHRTSNRYQLLGNLRSGDVSLSISNAQLTDSGIYGCRVDIPGWFNDQKHHLALVIQHAPETTRATSISRKMTTLGSTKMVEATTDLQTTTVLSVPPEPPTVAFRELSARSISLWWTAGFDGNIPITGYHVEYKIQTDSWKVVVRSSVLPWERETTINNLRPFSTYNIRMFARNGVGLSKASNELTITTKEAAPDGPPQDVKLEAISAHSIKVTWRAPELSLHNGLLRGYQLRYGEYSPQKELALEVVQLIDGEESFTVNHLQEATEYSVTVRSINSAGQGPWSQKLKCTTLRNDDLQQMTTTEETTEIQTEPSISTLGTITSTESWVIITDGPPQRSTTDDLQQMTTTEATTDIQTEPSISTLGTITSAESWVIITDGPPQRSTTGLGIKSTTWQPSDFTIDTQKFGSLEESGHLVAKLVPALLLGLVVVTAIIWQIRRTTLKKGNINIQWKSNDFVSFRDSEPAL